MRVDDSVQYRNGLRTIASSVRASARVTSKWNGKNLHPNPVHAGPGAENLPLISPLGLGAFSLLQIELRNSFNEGRLL